jgi:AbrB family transcriptional regulator, transcriptional pleiotropic regulator of transition state genes
MGENRKTFGIVRELDSLGRIVIPKETRDLLGIRLEDPVEFFSDEHTIIVRRYRSNCCIFCLESEGLIHFKGQLVCRKCITEILAQAGSIATAPAAAAPTEEKRRSQADKLKQMQLMLQDNPDLRQQDLAKKLGISQGYVSQLLRKINNSYDEYS